MDSSRNRTWADRLFLDHPRSLGMSWGEHGAGAAKIGLEMIAVGGACLIHALVPGWFTETGSRAIERLHSEIASRKPTSADSGDQGESGDLTGSEG